MLLLFGTGAPASESVIQPRIEQRKPHDPEAYTQGLLIDGDVWLESTGQYGKSELREVDRETGRVLRSQSLPKRYFGEGLALLNGKLYQLTWREGVCLVWNRERFELIQELTYEGEGWGLTTDGKVLYMSDGSSVIRVLNPDTFKELRRFEVRYRGGAVRNLNELEWVEGELWANVFETNRIVRISPRSGQVTGLLDFSHLPIAMDWHAEQDVFNGIARDPDTGEIWVTGKLWKALYRIQWPPVQNELKP
ncbi:MAG: glutaminyl-peptide cyclotransferase [Kiritimatiellia bacterium]